MTYSSEWWNAVRGQLPELFDGEAVTTGYRSYDAAQIPDSVRRQAWSKVLNLPELDQVRGKRVLAKFVENIPIGFARRFQLVVFAEGTDSQPLAAIADPEHWEQLDVVRRHLEITCDVCLAPEEEILAAINVAYKERLDQSQGIVTTMAASDEASSRELMDGMLQYEDLLDSSVHPPVIKLVNAVLLEAIKAGASDIHIQPLETELVVRQRIDGVLFDALKVPVEFRDEVISRMKVLGKMNIAEKRLPQDGRASVRVGDVAVDLRIASLPTSHGERVVVRFLDKGARLYTLNELGMADVMLTRFLELIKLEHGLLLVTGPTGSGKSTTLYAALQEINSETLNVLTLEDPIEYQLDGISQTQINTKKGLTFAKGLRNVLRQDPDIIMVGEIRDHETAEMAIQSALTGHFVFSTLHTNDSASAVTRLLDLGIEPYLVASSLVAVVAQRLVRKICDDCKEPYAAGNELRRLGIEDRDATLYRGKGCDRCRGTGYRGRVGVFELLTVNEAIGSLIQQKANAAEIRAAAKETGLKLLREDGIHKALKGATTVDEIVRVALRNSD